MKLITISGPQGCGKTTVAKALLSTLGQENGSYRTILVDEFTPASLAKAVNQCPDYIICCEQTDSPQGLTIQTEYI